MLSPIAPAGEVSSRAPAGDGSLPAGPSTAPAATSVAALDELAEAIPDTAATLAMDMARRAEVILLAHQSLQQDQQAKLDRMRADFNASQEERSEMLREMNALRDMAMEQSKKDDEILKKYIAMI